MVGVNELGATKFVIASIRALESEGPEPVPDPLRGRGAHLARRHCPGSLPFDEFQLQRTEIHEMVSRELPAPPSRSSAQRPSSPTLPPPYTSREMFRFIRIIDR